MQSRNDITEEKVRHWLDTWSMGNAMKDLAIAYLDMCKQAKSSQQLKSIAYMAGYYQAECSLPEHDNVAQGVEEFIYSIKKRMLTDVETVIQRHMDIVEYDKDSENEVADKVSEGYGNAAHNILCEVKIMKANL